MLQPKINTICRQIIFYFLSEKNNLYAICKEKAFAKRYLAP